MHDAGIALQNTLFQRVGELAAHLGRYDMYSLLLESLLTPYDACPKTLTRLVLRTRGESIKALLTLRGIPHQLCDRFKAIDEEIHPILDRQDICASNAALIYKINSSPPHGMTVKALQRDWFDLLNASDIELNTFIDRMEQDALQVVSLYLRLAALAGDIRDVTPALH